MTPLGSRHPSSLFRTQGIGSCCCWLCQGHLGPMESDHCLGRHFLCQGWLVLLETVLYIAPSSRSSCFSFLDAGIIVRYPAATLFSNRETKKMQAVAQTILNSCSELPGCRLKCRKEPAGLLDHQVPVALCGLILAFTICG